VNYFGVNLCGLPNILGDGIATMQRQRRRDTAAGPQH